jgi:hypothetical protein
MYRPGMTNSNFNNAAEINRDIQKREKRRMSPGDDDSDSSEDVFSPKDYGQLQQERLLKQM